MRSRTLRVFGSIRISRLASVAVAQTEPPPTATNFGLTSSGLVLRWYVGGLIGVIGWPAALATHTASSPTATPFGPLPTGIVLIFVVSRASIRMTVLVVL